MHPEKHPRTRNLPKTPPKTPLHLLAAAGYARGVRPSPPPLPSEACVAAMPPLSTSAGVKQVRVDITNLPWVSVHCPRGELHRKRSSRRTRRCHGSALQTRGVLRAQAPPGIACGARRSVHPTAPGAAGGGGSRNRRLAGAPRQNAGTQGGAAAPAVGVRLAGARRTALTGGVGCDWHAWHTALLSSGGAGCRQSVLRCMRPALRAA